MITPRAQDLDIRAENSDIDTLLTHWGHLSQMASFTSPKNCEVDS
jgi:hypothetical protein